MKVTGESIRKISEYVSILYVEDDIVLQTQVAAFLVKYFSKLDCIDNCDKALVLYKKKQYDLIITDLKMPGLNGVEFIKKIKKLNPFQHIIVTTVVESSKIMRILINLGINGFLLKPFEFNKLFRITYREVLNIYNRKMHESYRNEVENVRLLHQEIVDKLQFGIVVLELKKIIFTNNEFLRLTGFDTLEEMNRNIKNITDLFADNELKLLDNESFIDLLMDKQFLEITVLNIKSKTKKKVVAEISELSDFNKFLITFLNVQFLENHINNLKRRFFLSEYTKMPNIFSFKDRFDIFRNKKEDLYLILFSLKNFNTIKLYLGQKQSIEVLLKILRKIIDSLKITKIDKKVFKFDFGLNQYLFVTNEENMIKIRNIFKEINNKTYYHNTMKDEEEKVVPIVIKLETFIMKFDKSKHVKEILTEISDKFYDVTMK